MIQTQITFNPTSKTEVMEVYKMIKSLPCFQECEIESFFENKLAVEEDETTAIIPEQGRGEPINMQSDNCEVEDTASQLPQNIFDDTLVKEYFEVKEDGALSQTLIKADALFVAVKEGLDSKFIVNIETGPVFKACQNPEKYLLPYCIISEAAPDANTIVCHEKGLAHSQSGELFVDEKVKISLIKS